jgi:hypothetical protein
MPGLPIIRRPVHYVAGNIRDASTLESQILGKALRAHRRLSWAAKISAPLAKAGCGFELSEL